MYEFLLQIVIYVYLLKDVYKEEIDIEHSLLSPTKIFLILEEY